jgi:hypothetical protein
MSKRRVIATFLLLPLFVMFESLAWYGTNSVLFLYRVEDVDWGGLGMDSAEAASVHATTRLILPFALLLGGALAAGIGPWGLLLLGSALAVPALALLGAPLPWLAGVAGVLLVVAHGLLRPGVMSAAAATLRDQENLRTALIALVYTSLNVAAVVASMGAGKLQLAVGFKPVFVASAALMALAALVALVLVGVVLWTRRDAAENPPRALPAGPVLLGSAGLAAVVFLPWLGVMQAWELSWRIFDVAPLPLWLESLWMSVNPLFCCITGLLVASVAGGLHMAGKRIPTLFPMAAGMLVMVLGLAMVLGAGLMYSAWLGVAGIAVAAVGEAVLMAFFLSRLLGDLHWRAVPAVLAVWMAANDFGSLLMSTLNNSLGFEWMPQALGWTGVAAGLLGVLILAAAALPAQRRLWSPRG